MPRLSTKNRLRAVARLLVAVAAFGVQPAVDPVLSAPSGPARVLVFVTSDCPVANAFAPEVQRICRDYRDRGVECALVYEDLGIGGADVRRHQRAYGYRNILWVIDADRRIARAARATVTPQAVVVDRAAAIRYRGRINDFYAALGQPRQRVTGHDLREALDAILSGRDVPNPETPAVGCFIVDPPSSRKMP